MKTPYEADAVLLIAHPDRIAALSALLIQGGFCTSVRVASSLAQFHRALGANSASLALIDHPPGWADTLAIMQNIRHTQPACGLVLLVAADQADLVASALAAGVDAYVARDALLPEPVTLAFGVARARAQARRAEHVQAPAVEPLRDPLWLRETLLDLAPVGLTVLDRDFRYLWINRALAAQNQRPAAEHIGQPVREILPDLAPVVEPLFRQVLATRTPITDIEVVEERPDTESGPRIWHASYYPLADADGIPAGIGIIANDVTVQRETARALDDANAQYRYLFEHHPNPMWVFDHTTLAFLAVNDAAIQHYGYSREEFLAMTIADIRPPEDVAALKQAVAAHTGGLYGDNVWRHRRKDGSIIMVEVHAYRMNFQGRDATLVQISDVTARVEAAVALRHSEARIETIVSSLPMVLFALDAHGHCTLAMGKGMAVLGATPELLMGRSVQEVARDNPDILGQVSRALAGEALTTTAQLGSRTFETRFVPLRNEAGQIQEVLGVSLDISERVELTQQLLHAQRLESVGRLAGSVAHDFNNLLTAITGYTELALVELAPDSEAYAITEEIRATTVRATRLTQQLLTFARRQPIKPQTFVLNEVVRSLEPLLRQLLGANITLRLVLAPNLWPVVADAGQIEQVLVNLAVNARDAMPERGTLTITSANVYAMPDAPSTGADKRQPATPLVQLLVQDTGIGMDETVRAHVFEPFFTTKEPGKGTGLGLATAYGIITQHGGTIKIASAPRKGTTVTLTLPAGFAVAP